MLLACSDATKPSGTLVDRFYVLESVNGLAVPAILLSDSSEKFIVLEGGLRLRIDQTSEERVHEVDSTSQFGASEYDNITPASYEITGDSIEVGWFGGCRDLCRPNRVGRYSDSTITLANQGFPENGQVYLYRIVPDSTR